MVSSNPQISVDYVNEITVVTFTAEKILDEADIQALGDSIFPLIDQVEGISLVLDFQNVRFLTSSMLGLLIRISKKVIETAGKLRLCCITDKILEIFQITRLDNVFAICADRKRAIKSITG